MIFQTCLQQEFPSPNAMRTFYPTFAWAWRSPTTDPKQFRHPWNYNTKPLDPALPRRGFRNSIYTPSWETSQKNLNTTTENTADMGERAPMLALKSTPPITLPANSPSEQSAWTVPASAFDFRSDTITTPIASMLAAIQRTTLQDDCYQEDATTNDLEAYIAKRTCHEAGLFVLSGTMGNQLAVRTHLTQIPHSVLCDHRSHILTSEAGGIASLSQAIINGVVPSNGVYLKLEDIEKNVVLGDDVHGCPTKLISLENTLGGNIIPLSEVKRIGAFARQHNIRFHLDGARLWNAVTAGAGSLADYCKEFDSVQLCFSKGLGAPIGSILVGEKDFIKKARWIRKSIGGGLRQVGVLTAAARVAVDENFGKGPNGEDGKLLGSHKIAKNIADTWTRLGGILIKPTETNMVWLDLEDANISISDFVDQGKAKGLKLLGGRLVVHYQISEDAVKALEDLMKEIINKKATNGSSPKQKVGGKVYGQQ